MRRTHRDGGFFLCLLFNMLLNAKGAIPAAALLGMHIWRGWSLWWAAGAFLIWMAWLVAGTLFLGFANRCGNTPAPKRANRNPYSAKQTSGRCADRPDE